MRLHTTLLFVLILTSSTLIAQEVDTDKLFYQAVYAEQIDGDLEKARSLYQQIIKAKPTDRTIMAKTLYRLGLITEKDGAKQALGFYTKVVEEYPEQKDLIQLVQSRVDKLEDANTFIDERDGHKYKYVQIGNQIWMAENLAYMPHVNPVKKQEYGIWVYDYDGSDVAEAKATENYQKYGCLYDWTMAMDIDPKYLEETWDGKSENHRGICPDGWHLPTDQEWMELEVFLGFPKDKVAAHDEDAGAGFRFGIENIGIGRKLKSSYGWLSGGNGSDSIAFKALPSGIRHFDQINGFQFKYLGQVTNYWTSTILLDSLWSPSSFTRMLNSLGRYKKPDNQTYKMAVEWSNGYSVRCVKNNFLRSSKTVPTSKKQNRIRKSSSAMNMQFKEISPKLNKLKVKVNYGWKIDFYNGLMIYFDKDSNTINCYNVNEESLLWNYPCSSLENPFTISNGKVLYCYKSSVYKTDIESGKNVWEWDSGGKTATIDDEVINNKVFVRLYERSKDNKWLNCELVALQMNNGELIWKYLIPEFLLPTQVSVSDGIVVAGLRVVGMARYNEMPDGKNKTTLIAINENSGELIWEFNSVGLSSSCKPLINDGYVIFSNIGDQYLYKLVLESGKLDRKTYIDNRTASIIIPINNKYFFVEMNFDESKQSVAYLVSDSFDKVEKIELGSGATYHFDFVIIENNIYVRSQGDGSGHISAINLGNYKKVLQINIPDGARYMSDLVDGRIYLSGRTGYYWFNYSEIATLL